MSELGARLRQARENQGLSLAQAATDTRILQQSLLALEEGAYQRLPSDVVTRGFIRNYAHYLDLPADELIELYRRERGATDRIKVVPATRAPRTRSFVLPSFFGVFFVTVALVGMAYVVLNATGSFRQEAGTGAAPSPSIPPPSPLPSVIAGPAPTILLPQRTAGPASTALAAAPTTGPAGGSAPTSAVSATPAAPIVLEVFVPTARGNESSWVRIQTDGNIAFEGIMRAGDRQTFLAQRRVEIRAGNPPDVQVVVNGLQQGALGQVPGQPVNWPWPPN